MAALLVLFSAAGHAQSSFSAADLDEDGLPDAWETAFGLDPNSSSGVNGAGGDPDLDGRTNTVEYAAGTHPRGLYRQYFAEGARGPYWSTRLAVANPATSATARAQVLVLNDDGSTVSRTLVIPPLSRTTVDFRDMEGVTGAFSVVLESDALLAADRTMTWDDGRFGAHTEAGLPGPSTSWFFAEGATHSGFALYYLVQNPNDSSVRVTALYLLPTGPPETKTYVVGPRSRLTIWVNDEAPRLAAADVAARFTATLPVTVERSMYLKVDGRFTAGHAAAGATAPSTRWFFGEGCTGPFFDTFVLVGNPGPETALIRATYRTDAGILVERMYTVEPWTRLTIWVDQQAPELEDVSASIEIASTTGVPVVAERTMWWPGAAGAGTWYEAHASLGSTSTGTRWLFAEGEVSLSPGRDTYLLVANTSGREGTVRVTLLPEDGPEPVVQTWTVPAQSRLTVSVARDFPELGEGRFAALVESVGSDPVPIAAERSMYATTAGQTWNQGTNARGLDYSFPLRDVGAVELDPGSQPVELLLAQLDLLPAGVSFSVEQTDPELARVSVTAATATMLIAPVGGSIGTTLVTVTAFAPDGRTASRTFLLTLGGPRPREHVAMLTGPGSYSVDTDTGAPPVNRFLRIENVGGTTVEGITFSRAGHDWSTVDRIVAGIVSPFMRADERARAIWQFVRTARTKAQPPTVNPDIHDPVVLFNSFGYGYCDDTATVLALLLEAAGLPTRLTNLPGHVVAEAYYDGDWHLFDADLDGLYLERDNLRVASLADVTADPWLIERAGWRHVWVQSIYAAPGPRVSYPPSLAASRIHDSAATLRPAESIELRWNGFGPRFSDGSIEATSPVTHANGVLSSRLEAVDDASRQWLFDERQVHVTGDAGGTPAFTPSADDVDAEMTYRLAAPWPLVEADLELDAFNAPGTQLEVAVSSSGTGVDLNWWELANGRYRLADVFVEERNIRNYLEAGEGSALHPRLPAVPAALVYRFPLRPGSGARFRVGGWFFRCTSLDRLSLFFSVDGVDWIGAWDMARTGSHLHVEDLTERVAGLEEVFVKVEFEAASEGCSVGLDSLMVEGIGPFAFNTVWSAATEGLTGMHHLALRQVLSPSPSKEPVFEYFVRLRMRGSPRNAVGVSRLITRSVFQVAPLSLPTLQPGRTTFVYNDATPGDHLVKITHAWYEDSRRRAPLAPTRAQQPEEAPEVDVSSPFLLAWDAHADPDGDAVLAYHVQICERADCLYPIGAMVDVVETWSDPGPDGAFGTSDDGVTTPMWSAHTVLENTLFSPGRRYYWRVRVQDATGLWGPFGPVWSFTVRGS